jgi:hypothetical protein
LGASQGDLANLKGQDVDWTNGTVSFTRKKTGVPVIVHLGSDALNLLKDLPAEGLLFPYLASVRANDRATEFGQRCRQLGIKGISLHSYRYAWAERAKVAGYPERFGDDKVRREELVDDCRLNHVAPWLRRCLNRKACRISSRRNQRPQNLLKESRGPGLNSFLNKRHNDKRRSVEFALRLPNYSYVTRMLNLGGFGNLQTRTESLINPEELAVRLKDVRELVVKFRIKAKLTLEGI